MFFLNMACKKPNENNKIVDISGFIDFLEEVRKDYQNNGAQLRIALDEFTECNKVLNFFYNAFIVNL